MNITKEYLATKRKELIAQRDQNQLLVANIEAELTRGKANIAACEGAIQVIDMLTKEISSSEQVETTPSPKG